ncbi:type II secretion system protein [Pelomonas sp. UHG3]|uniref:Type II secretion system protein n=1 Tax=Roseateles hydrophilus TaxID=2975054 RepID=A0ACC6CCC5_9BURK|nr:type II secretion system protein [Pelomonas sp. UHG3]MCY4746071.1 type II secretion system protein [Pelomonas sp. UHG3]
MRKSGARPPSPARAGRRGRAWRGFTLIEMLVVLAMLGVLASAARPLLELSVQRSREHELRQGLRTLREAIDAYKRAGEAGHIAQDADASGYPPHLRALVDGVADAKSAEGRKLYFLRRLPRDPFAPAELPAAETWGLRAYDSPPDEPRAGKDVFDVYSRAERTALDGSRLKDW